MEPLRRPDLSAFVPVAYANVKRLLSPKWAGQNGGGRAESELPIVSRLRVAGRACHVVLLLWPARGTAFRHDRGAERHSEANREQDPRGALLYPRYFFPTKL